MNPARPLAALTLAAVALSQEPAEDEPRYAHPELLVGTEWLAAHAADAGIRIVDAREKDDYAAGHIPGAVSIPRSATFASEGPRGMVAPAEDVAALFGAQGIDAKTHVVVYDEGKSTAAARVFWTLELHGHPRVTVLDGGIAKWTAEERAVTQALPTVEPAELVCTPRPARCSTKANLLAAIEAGTLVPVDSRSDREVAGGRLPGAVHVEWTRNYTDDDVPIFLPPAQLAQLYAAVPKDKAVHAY